MRRAKIRMTVEFDVPWDHDPQYCTPDHINFVLNEGTRCADESIDALTAFAKKKGCLCGHAKHEFLGFVEDVAGAVEAQQRT